MSEPRGPADDHRCIVHRVVLTSEVTEVELPCAARTLYVDWKRGEPQPSLWYVFHVRYAEALTRRRFLIVGTGHEFTDVAPNHVGTVIAPDGFHVFHVFEVEVPIERGGPMPC